MSKIWRGFDEDELRELIWDAVYFARATSPNNISEAAVVQRAMKEEFVDGQWRSKLFNEQRESAKALEGLAEIFARREKDRPEVVL